MAIAVPAYTRHTKPIAKITKARMALSTTPSLHPVISLLLFLGFSLVEGRIICSSVMVDEAVVWDMPSCALRDLCSCTPSSRTMCDCCGRCWWTMSMLRAPWLPPLRLRLATVSGVSPRM